eukprot:snap_masked-scaffold_1-processed-gene-27.32-mRNA-1 protein AED:1.00 eAED:1.00 QI:0/0/0/0/1/1/6/0/690
MKFRFQECSISYENFKILSQKNIFPDMRIAEFEACKILSFTSLELFISARKKVQAWVFKCNGFCLSELSILFKSLSENSNIKTLVIREQAETNNTFDQEKSIKQVKNFLGNHKTIRVLGFGISGITQYKGNLQKRVNNHPSLLYLAIEEDLYKNKKNVLNCYQSMLQKRYDYSLPLKELQLLFMGDSRSGKTSTIRSFCNKKFLRDVESTLVLEDTNILKIDGNTFTPLTKYQLSVQRVKNVLAMEYNQYHEVGNTSKYTLPFEKELVEQTVDNEEFLQYFTGESTIFSAVDPFYRIYDFGGQEVFSTVHHLFMNPNAVYIIVFNLTKQNDEDMNRLKFWLKSIVKNAPISPILFIGTYLKLFLRKNNQELKKIEQRILNYVSETSEDFQVPKNNSIRFFPIENSNPSTGTLAKIHKELKYFANDGDLANSFFAVELSLPCVWILFLDSCREETNYMSVLKFRNKGRLCNFTEENMENMLDIYSRAGIIFYHRKLEISEEDNFIFFAPSFIAQALGSFIRDPSLHQLAFRLNIDIFPEYRKYIDTGIIRKTLFDTLLQKYSKQERNYVLQIALSSFILFKFDERTESYILPELIPVLKDIRIKPSTNSEECIEFDEPISLTTFVEAVLQFKKEHQPNDVLLYRYFARFIFNPEKVVDMFLETEKRIGFKLVKNWWLHHKMAKIKKQFGKK